MNLQNWQVLLRRQNSHTVLIGQNYSMDKSVHFAEDQLNVT